jgi:hypothetical protein
MAYMTLEIGTKFKWILNDETYRVAIQTADGVLQVKSVTDGGGEVHDDTCACNPCAHFNMSPRPPWQQTRPLKKTPFPDYSSWLKSLPKGGKTTLTLPNTENSIQSRATVPKGLTDYEKVETLQRNFNLRSFVFQTLSPNEKQKFLLENMKRLTYAYMDCPYGPNTDEFKRLKRDVQSSRRAYRKQSIITSMYTEEEANQPIYKFCKRGTGKLLVRCGGNMYNITTHNSIICRDDGKVFKDFAEMGADTAESGSPALFVKYRGRYVTV